MFVVVAAVAVTLPGVAYAANYDPEGARSYAGRNWNKDIVSNAVGEGAQLNAQDCTLFVSACLDTRVEESPPNPGLGTGGGIAKVTSGSHQWYMRVAGGQVHYYEWTQSWTVATQLRNYFRDHCPSGLDYDFVGQWDYDSGTGNPEPPDYMSSLRHADCLLYDSDGNWVFDHSAIEANNNATVQKCPSDGDHYPLAGHTQGTTKHQHNNRHKNHLVSLRDNYTLSKLRSEKKRVIVYRIVDLTP